MPYGTLTVDDVPRSSFLQFLYRAEIFTISYSFFAGIIGSMLGLILIFPAISIILTGLIAFFGFPVNGLFSIIMYFLLFLNLYIASLAFSLFFGISALRRSIALHIMRKRATLKKRKIICERIAQLAKFVISITCLLVLHAIVFSCVPEDGGQSYIMIFRWTITIGVISTIIRGAIPMLEMDEITV